MRDHCQKEKVGDQVPRSRARSEIQSTTPTTKSKKRNSNRKNDEVSNVDHDVTGAKTIQFEARLYIFEDNEAVIEMFIKCRSPAMRHESRIHRVALDWLFDRINVDPKNQLADMLTRGHFTRDEWSHRLRVLNIMNFSMISCSYFLSIEKPNTMSKSAQERRTGEEPVEAKSRPVSLILRSLSADQPPMLDSGTSYSLESCRLGWNSDLTGPEKSGRERSENSASSSQVWHRDDNPFTSTERSGRETNQRSSTGNPHQDSHRPTIDLSGIPLLTPCFPTVHQAS